MITKALLTFAVLAAAALTASAQTTNPSVSPAPAATVAARGEASGTIADHTPETALVLNTGATEPAHFKFAAKVTFLDKDGKDIEAAALTKNMRVRVFYVKSGPDMTVDKVVLLE